LTASVGIPAHRQCTGRGNCTIDGAQGKCVCKGGFLGADCSLVDYQFGV
jgi:hypothetical protein